MSKKTDEEGVDRDEFNRRMDEVIKSKMAPNTFLLKRDRYHRLLEQIKSAKTNYPKTPADFRRMKRFEIVDTPDGERIFMAEKIGETRQMYIPVEEMYDVIRDYHLQLNHGGRSRMMVEIKKKYRNITAQSVLLYISMCKGCKHKAVKRKMTDDLSAIKSLGEEFKPDAEYYEYEDSDPLINLGSELNSEIEDITQSFTKVYPELYSRGQVDILEATAEPNEEFKFLMVYRDFVSKFIHLKPLRVTNVEDTVHALLDIFLVFGAPNILQSKNGMPVTMPICRRVSTIRPEIKIVAGESSVSQEFTGKSNQDILRKLNEWLRLNKHSKWQEGLKFVQHSLNTTFHKTICRTPSEMVFGVNPRKGIAAAMPSDATDCLTTEDDLKRALEQTEAGSSSTKTIKLEESLILPCNFIKKEPDNIDDDDMFIDDDDNDE